MKVNTMFLKPIYSLCFFLPFTFLVTLLPMSSSLFADRILLNDGGLLRGKLIGVEGRSYRFRRLDGKTENVPKYSIKKLALRGSKPEMGYECFFTRLLVGVGSSEYELNLGSQQAAVQSKGDESSSFGPRLGLEAGWQVLDYKLALHGGVDYTGLILFGDSDTKFSYASLNLGASYYLPFQILSPYIHYVGLQFRVPLGGTLEFHSDIGNGKTPLAIPIESGGLGFGISIGKEWYASDRIVYGVAFSYTTDSLKTPARTAQGDASSVSPGASSQRVQFQETQSTLDHVGFTFTLAYD